ncbi:EthD domain-containing protein [Edaphosphingomonas haloaromaticamans]|uniref:EthD domain-containing protein n=1 Tax=Edaphosphingomonas haloaromaticamans TaxID=653954 RepID=A0A1S1HFL2_9SPHN|nr:EthD domain-containing protein [Sphingomonas haloaromaticamans]OHT20286.1 hypothetical protein BHE75_02282 [Sphingomonas haloaromaticamans]
MIAISCRAIDPDRPEIAPSDGESATGSRLLLSLDRVRGQHRGMMKSIGFLPRLAGIARPDFRNYYETRHAPLADSYFHFAGYVRNHIVDGQEPGFDCISEFWTADPAAIATLLAGEAGERMRADERNFADSPNIRPALAEPAPTGRLVPLGPRTVQLLGGHDNARLIAAVAASAGAEAVTLDFLTPFDAASRAPCDALLIREGTAAAAPSLPSGWTLLASLQVVAEGALPISPQPAV